MSNVSIQGIRELISKLENMKGAQADEMLERGLLKAGNKVRNRAVMLCPVATGGLRNSIRVAKIAPKTVSVGTNMEYAIFVEFGTGTKGDPSISHTSKKVWRYQDEDGVWHTCHGTAAQPFLRPAFKSDEIRRTVCEEIKKGIANV